MLKCGDLRPGAPRTRTHRWEHGRAEPRETRIWSLLSMILWRWIDVIMSRIIVKNLPSGVSVLIMLPSHVTKLFLNIYYRIVSEYKIFIASGTTCTRIGNKVHWYMDTRLTKQKKNNKKTNTRKQKLNIEDGTSNTLAKSQILARGRPCKCAS